MNLKMARKVECVRVVTINEKATFLQGSTDAWMDRVKPETDNDIGSVLQHLFGPRSTVS